MANPLRIMVDTNILYSAILHGQIIGDMLNKITSNYLLLISEAAVDELFDVVGRRRPEKLWAIEDVLENTPYEKIDSGNIAPGLFKIRDATDYPILHAAIRGNADILITGDKDFSDVQINKPKILTPAEFLDEY